MHPGGPWLVHPGAGRTRMSSENSPAQPSSPIAPARSKGSSWIVAMNPTCFRETTTKALDLISPPREDDPAHVCVPFKTQNGGPPVQLCNFLFSYHWCLFFLIKIWIFFCYVEAIKSYESCMYSAEFFFSWPIGACVPLPLSTLVCISYK